MNIDLVLFYHVDRGRRLHFLGAFTDQDDVELFDIASQRPLWDMVVTTRPLWKACRGSLAWDYAPERNPEILTLGFRPVSRHDEVYFVTTEDTERFSLPTKELGLSPQRLYAFIVPKRY